MGSLTLSSLNFNKTASVNSPNMIQQICTRMNERGIKPELEVFDSGMINYAKYLIKNGMLNDLPQNSIAALGGIGNAQLPINAMAISMGLGIRIGLEDNIWLDEERTQLATNSDYLQRIKGISQALNREICTPMELREILELKKGYGEYGV